MAGERNTQTAPGQRASPSSDSGISSVAVARLAPTAPAARLSASASPAPGGPDKASSPQSLCFFPSDDLSGRAGAFPLVMGGAVGSQCSNRNGRADHAHPLWDSRSPDDLPRPGYGLTPSYREFSLSSDKRASPGSFSCLLPLKLSCEKSKKPSWTLVWRTSASGGNAMRSPVRSARGSPGAPGALTA
jgi:hypothetical protein